ncbi:class I SAM-dependent methyltransferase [Aliikangiella sp. G2MR2-5]|uniref:class I SAM-dependent methyltransferase n=1 Tax=Aliikangiella sp. G2MR2-5 TaxID=2788943 RepID=UPI0018AC7619|nr:class I SAM-dependent methyltransferase [Aliikangiella sp. G2MR2-5]
MRVALKTLKLIAILCFFSSSIASAVDSKGRLVSDLERDKRSKPEEVIEFVGVKAGEKVLDLLGGGGYYSHLLSHQVGKNGLVVLHNNKAYLPYVGKDLEKRFKNNELKNVERLMSEADELKLGMDRFDSAFFVMGFHDLYHTSPGWDVTEEKVLPQLRAALKTKGKLLVIDHNAPVGSGKQSAQDMHRIEKAFVIEKLKHYGFHLLGESEILVNSKDPLNISAFDKSLKRNTSRFALLFEKQ